jgi:hypothetical protein
MSLPAPLANTKTILQSSHNTCENHHMHRIDTDHLPGNLMTLTLFPSSTNRCSSSLTCVVLPLLSKPSRTTSAPRAMPPAAAAPPPSSTLDDCCAGAAVGAAISSVPPKRCELLSGADVPEEAIATARAAASVAAVARSLIVAGAISGAGRRGSFLGRWKVWMLVLGETETKMDTGN